MFVLTAGEHAAEGSIWVDDLVLSSREELESISLLEDCAIVQRDVKTGRKSGVTRA